ncbi:MAG: hypothetical protein ABI317_09620, partial [Gaiellales bacterium]
MRLAWMVLWRTVIGAVFGWAGVALVTSSTAIRVLGAVVGAVLLTQGFWAAVVRMALYAVRAPEGGHRPRRMAEPVRHLDVVLQAARMTLRQLGPANDVAGGGLAKGRVATREAARAAARAGYGDQV